MSDESRKKYTTEEVYVILFMLSDGSDEIAKIARGMTSSDIDSDFIKQNESGALGEI